MFIYIYIYIYIYIDIYFTVAKKSILQASVRYNNVILAHFLLQGLIVKVKMCDRQTHIQVFACRASLCVWPTLSSNEREGLICGDSSAPRQL